MPPFPVPRLLMLPLMAALLLAGCASSPGSLPASEPAVDSSAPAAPAGYPLTVENCGTTVTLEQRPERLVTVKSTSTELVLALGLADRLVGTAFADGPLPEPWSAAAEGVPVLSDAAPGLEAVLALEPDLVIAGWESNFSADGMGERESLRDLGVATYVSPAACREPGQRPPSIRFEDVFAGIEEMGALLGAEQAARELVADQRSTVAGIVPDERGLSALWYSSGNDTPYVGAGTGAPQMILDAIGLRNVAGDIDDSWAPLGWEAVVAADPDVIVLVDAAWNTAESKKERLRSDPATAGLGAVRQERYLVVPFPASEAGVRNAEAAADLSRQLGTLDLS